MQPIDARLSLTSLQEVANYQTFTQSIPLTADQERLLRQNLFVCTPSDAEQLFYIYENNDYLNLPSFITTDSVLHLYHIFYDFTLRTVETETLLPVLERLTRGMLAASQATWKEVGEPELKQAALRNVAFFGVAARLLGQETALPPEAGDLVDPELALIEKHEGFSVGAIFPYKIDYSQFIPRGHYTRSEDLKRFFRSMMWYGLAPFALYYAGPQGRMRADEPIRQGLLLARSLQKAGLHEDWATIYEPTVFFVGSADDHTPAEWNRLSDQVFGPQAPLVAFLDDRKFDAFVAAAETLRQARIQARLALVDRAPDPRSQLRFMGQRYIPDSEILQRLVAPIERPFPAGLDVMAVLGSERAGSILDAHPEIYNPGKWDGYQPERAKLTREFAAVEAATWTSNLYWSWLYALRALLEPPAAGAPAFMRNDAWIDKSLYTALASWAELRHDTILYGKQSAVECGDGEQPFIKGYVEPQVEFYDRLLQLTVRSRQGLEERALLPDRLKDRFEEFENLVAFLKRVSEKELAGEALTEEEHLEIRYMGGKMEYLTMSVMEGEPTNWQLVNETDRDMAVVADVHTAVPNVLEEAVGHAHEILVIAPVEGLPTLTRGAAFSYYEFTQPMDDRLTDERWQQILKAGQAPEAPIWTKSFLVPASPEAASDERKVYSSGC